MERVIVTFNYINRGDEPVNPGSAVGTTMPWETGVKPEYTWTDSILYSGDDCYDGDEDALFEQLSEKYGDFEILRETMNISIEDVEFTNENGQTPDASTPENTSTLIDDAPVQPNVSIGNAPVQPEVSLIDEITNSFKNHVTWDPRLYRVDEFLLTDESGKGIRAPFGSYTAATAFADMASKLEAGVVQAMVEKNKLSANSELGKAFVQLKENWQNESTNSNDNASKTVLTLNSDLLLTDDLTVLENADINWGVQSIMNPYSLTKLVGGLSIHGNTAENYMYDIRDHRRFYAMQNSNDNFTAISNPTVTELIKWSNADQWGRTPYSFQDFVYCKYFGLIPNNRLITFRRYTSPTYDNLQFENMYGDQQQTTQNENGTTQAQAANTLSTENTTNKTFSPLATVITWFGGDTGNSLNSLMSFSTGTNWEDLKSDIWNVEGDTGESPQAVIDKFLGTSYGKFYLAANGKFNEPEDIFKQRTGLNQDPWDSTYRNRVQGPINRIDAVKRRVAGIKFSQSLNIKCSYKAKAIGGINPKAALLDVLGNCMEMCSPHAVFWGGGHRFMIDPRIYPFHDGGWRDNFMARIYEGKFLGDDGAIATVLSGFKKVGEDGKGHFDFDTAKGLLGKLGGTALGLLGSAISSISDMFGGVGFLTNASEKVFQAGADVSGEEKDAIKEKAGNILTNLKQMWHNRMMSATALPSIKVGGNILVGEPTGEWHLTVGNPLNPIMVIGNLICTEMKVSWDDEIGPDDFPIGFSVDYTIEHAMARDSEGIQSMFNRGMGKFYALPDYITTSSEQTTWVDKYTKDTGGGVVGNNIKYKNPTPLWQEEFGTGIEDKSHYQRLDIQPGSKPKNSGTYNTTLITKFTPMNTQAMRSVNDRRLGHAQSSDAVISRVRSLAATRKLINN